MAYGFECVQIYVFNIFRLYTCLRNQCLSITVYFYAAFEIFGIVEFTENNLNSLKLIYASFKFCNVNSYIENIYTSIYIYFIIYKNLCDNCHNQTCL